MVDRAGIIEVMQTEGARQHPREACGFVIAVGKKQEVVVCENISPHDMQFQIAPGDYVATSERGEIVGAWHTHPDMTSEPSEADLAGIEVTGVPWFIMGVYKTIDGFVYQDMTVTEPTGVPVEYIGRPYVPGILDCYSLVRDFYRNEFGIALGDYPRVLADGSPGNVVFIDQFKEQGFVEVTGEPRIGDLFLIQVTGDVPTHIAIYVGDDEILHHCHDRISRKDTYACKWGKYVSHHIRNKKC